MNSNSSFREYAYPIGFDSWGFIGDYIKYYYTHPGAKNRPWYKSIKNLKLALTSPFLGLSILNEGLNDRLFKFGLFNATTIHEFGKQLKSYTLNCENLLHSKNSTRFKAKVYYDSIEIGASIEEIQIRYYQQSIEKIEENPPILQLIINNTTIDNTDNLYHWKYWFDNIFIGKSNFPFQLIFGLAYEYAPYFSNTRKLSNFDFSKIESDLSSIVKSFLLEVIRESKRNDSISDSILNLIEKYYLNCSVKSSSLEVLNNKILALPLIKLVAKYEEIFLPILNLYLGELFHHIDAPIADFSKFDWDWERKLVLEKFNAGEKFLAFMVHTNGECGIWNYENSEYAKGGMSYDDEIDYHEKIPIFVNNAGVFIMSILTWEEIKQGAISSILPKKI